MSYSTIATESPAEFIGRALKSVLQAPNGPAAVAALPGIFDRDFTLMLNGQHLGWAWLEPHVQEVYIRLQRVSVEVTHAVRQGSVLMERHLVSGITRDTTEPFQLEVMATYELTPDHRIKTWYELTQIRTGEYTGW